MLPTNLEFDTKISLGQDVAGVIDELPFYFLMLGDWSGDGGKASLPERRPIEIDRDNFNEVLTRIKPSLTLDLFEDGNSLTLEFNDLDDFHPDSIFRQVHLFSDLRDLRRRLLKPETFNGAAREVRSWFDSDETVDANTDAIKQSEPAGNLLDQILSGGNSQSSSDVYSTDLDKLLRELVKPHLVGFDENEQAKLVAAVDDATGSLMRMILHHSKFQMLESAWRGLYFLVREVETGADLKIFILNVTKAELSLNLKSVSSLADSLPYRWLFSDTPEALGQQSWAFICGNFAFEPTIDDIAVLMRIAKLSAAARSPFISHIRPQLLGIKSFFESPDVESWDFSEDTDAGKLWTALRSLPESNYLGLALPRFLARLPFGERTEPLESFSFEEMTEDSLHDQFLWANSCFVCALLLAQSFQNSAWDMNQFLKQDLEGLPIYITNKNGETFIKPCAEIVFTQKACEKMMEYGLMPLISFCDTDRVRLARFQSISNPVTSLSAKWMDV